MQGKAKNLSDFVRQAIKDQLLGARYESDEYHSAVAKSIDEARKLVEEGFEYVCQKDDLMLFRKRK